VCDIETSRIGAPYIYDISNLRVKGFMGSRVDPDILEKRKYFVSMRIRTPDLPARSPVPKINYGNNTKIMIIIITQSMEQVGRVAQSV
jgi:hypothetical protein